MVPDAGHGPIGEQVVFFGLFRVVGDFLVIEHIFAALGTVHLEMDPAAVTGTRRCPERELHLFVPLVDFSVGRHIGFVGLG